MQVRICSRQEIETLARQGFQDRAAVISFYDEGREPLDLSGTNYDVFQVTVENIGIEDLDKFGLTYKTYFPEAEELARFIFDARNDGLEIICQCERGQGRSAGCAAAIRQFFDGDGIEVFANYNYFPNLLMYHKVYNSLIVESFERGEIDCKY